MFGQPQKTDPEKILFAVHGYLILFDIIQYMYVTMYIYSIYIYVYTNISWLNTVILCNMTFFVNLGSMEWQMLIFDVLP